MHSHDLPTPEPERRPAAGPGFAVVACLLAGLTTCQVPGDDLLQKRTFFCDSAGTGETCGTAPDGTAMTCYQASQLGARDFCAEPCPGADPLASGADWRCVDARSKLRTCRPEAGAAACSASDMQCLRTDGLQDEGVCLPMNTCSSDAQCQDPDRPSCMGTLLEEFYGPAAGIRRDQWPCLKTKCLARLSACARGETCLPTVIPPASQPIDMCVPNCDLHFNCPPNFLCLKRVSGPAAPPVCLPGILGFRCESDIDCLLGACVDGGDGFKVCATTCQGDADCARFGYARGAFMCADLPGGRGRHCQNARSYAGTSCGTDAQCRPHEACVRQSPYFSSLMETGECRARCGPGLPCQDRGGVPHVCLELAGVQTCYPGRLHLPCAEDGDCVGDLRCLEVTTLDRQDHLSAARRCSLPCHSDEDCHANRFTEGIAYCSEERCIARRHSGMLCQSDGECVTRSCQVSTVAAETAAGIRRCL